MKQQENRAEPQEKQIRFIDSHYNLKFYIPDGGKIKITFRDGHTADRVCKYIDDYHLYVGNCCYHICEFAEKMELSGSFASYVLTRLVTFINVHPIFRRTDLPGFFP